MKTRIKICGITAAGDARHAARSGADYIGVIVDIAGTPRSVPVAAAARLRACCDVPLIMLADMQPAQLLDAVAAVSPAGVQLVGHYTDDAVCEIARSSGCAVWRTVYLPPAGAAHAAAELMAIINASKTAGVAVVVCDTGMAGRKGGTGTTGDWGIARELVAGSSLPVFLAGGITPDNVGEALALVQPYGIDVSSGVERQPGVKDFRKIELLVQNVRAYDVRAAR